MERRMNRRQRQAEGTKQDILAAARELFVEQGYARAAMAGIAERAGVAVQTIYDSIGSKRALAMALVELVDEEAAVGRLAAEIAAEPRPERLIALHLQITRQVQERCGDIVAALESAAMVEPELRAAIAEGNRRHHEGAQTVARRLEAMGALRPELTASEAADLIEVLTSPNSRTTLIHNGLSFDGYERLLNRALQRLLLREG
jgi:AcrR family transcriptional regulator